MKITLLFIAFVFTTVSAKAEEVCIYSSAAMDTAGIPNLENHSIVTAQTGNLVELPNFYGLDIKYDPSQGFIVEGLPNSSSGPRISMERNVLQISKQEIDGGMSATSVVCRAR